MEFAEGRGYQICNVFAYFTFEQLAAQPSRPTNDPLIIAVESEEHLGVRSLARPVLLPLKSAPALPYDDDLERLIESLVAPLTMSMPSRPSPPSLLMLNGV